VAGQKYNIGMIGLGVMGRNLVLNMADHGFSVAGYDLDPAKVNALRSEAGDRPVKGAASHPEFFGLLRAPRTVMMLVPAGAPVDSVIRAALPHLEPDDLLVDAGNSHFKDTERRAEYLAERHIHYLGVGISGGESGARTGPSIMPGGSRPAYERVRAIFEAVAAKVDGEACVTYLGPGSSGHYVKMVHNGIEYGLMRLIADAYDFMKRGLGLSNDDLGDTFDAWKGGEIAAYLIEITAKIFRRRDEQTGSRLIDLILDEAEQEGTGKWTSQDAMDLYVPIPTIDAAVSARDLSVMKKDRENASSALGGEIGRFSGNRDECLDQIRKALYASMLITYSQGLSLLRAASSARGYFLNLGDIVRIWRGGCIIRAALLEKIRTALRRRPDLAHLLLDPVLGEEVKSRIQDFRAAVCTAAGLGIPVPGFMASLSYYDGLRSARLPANLIQAQRDFFGSHTYKRTDIPGIFHTRWDDR